MEQVAVKRFEVAVKRFEVEHGSTPGGYHQILIRFRGVIVENIHVATQSGAFLEMGRRGYCIVPPEVAVRLMR